MPDPQQQTFTDVQPIQQSFTNVMPIEEPTSQEGTGFLSHVGQSLKQLGTSLITPPPVPTSIGDAVKQGVLAGTGAVGSLIDASKEAFAARGRGKSIPYSVAAGAGSVLGVNAERMEKAAEQGDTGGVLGEAAVPTALAVGGAATKAVGDALPSTARAGAALQDVKASAGHIPIDMSGPGDTALQIYYEAKHGAFLPPPVNALLKRIGLDPEGRSMMEPNARSISYQTAVNRGTLDPDIPPMTYQEAKSFQSNISALSASDKMSINPNIKRLVGQLNSDLKGSLEGAADTVGKGQKFQQAMQEYHHAMQLRGFTEEAIDKAWKAGLGALGLGVAKKLYDAM
jgi:hypothetical protein